MRCATVREAISAQLDGEASPVSAEHVAAHLAGCADCRAWCELAHTVTRRARIGRPVPPSDLPERILAAIQARPPRAVGARRILLVVVAMLQLAVTVPLLVLGHDHDAGRHAAHELGSFDFALAIAFVIGAWRPALSEGLAWAAGVAALGLVGTALLDWTAGQTPGVDEAQHLVAAAGALLLVWQARHYRSQAAAGRSQSAMPWALLLDDDQSAESDLTAQELGPDVASANRDAVGDVA
jgi:predicted anti-sigma-YlaC factor YlaD